MGLDVMFYTDVKPFQCPCLKKIEDLTVQWQKEGTRMAASIEFVYESERKDYTPVTFESYDIPDRSDPNCACHDNNNLKSIDVGRISHYDHDGVFKPGQIIEFKDSDGFYFGSMGKTRRVEEIVNEYCREKDIADPMAEMDWSEGFYSGKFLLWFKKYLGLIVHLHPQLQAYMDLISTVSEEDLVTKCVIIHC